MSAYPDFPNEMARTTARHAPETIVPVPRIVRQRGWECAFTVGAEHSAELRDKLGADAGNTVWHWAQQAVVRGPDGMTWADCRQAFRAHRLVFGVRQ